MYSKFTLKIAVGLCADGIWRHLQEGGCSRCRPRHQGLDLPYCHIKFKAQSQRQRQWQRQNEVKTIEKAAAQGVDLITKVWIYLVDSDTLSERPVTFRAKRDMTWAAKTQSQRQIQEGVDLVTKVWICLLIVTYSKRPVTFEKFEQSDDEIWPEQPENNDKDKN